MVTRPGGRPHLWVVLTEPAGVPSQVAIVSFSSDDGRKDRTVRLGPRDHPYIWKPTIAFYTDTQIYDVAALEAAVATGLATFHDDCTEDLLETLRQGALDSPETPRREKRYIQERI